MIDYIINMELPLWVPFILTLLLCISLYQLGRADERRRHTITERHRRHKARSILLPMR